MPPEGRRAGVATCRDPGSSFGMTAHRDLDVLRRLRSYGGPICIATSRENYIRGVLGLPIVELLEGTAAAVAYGVAQGAQLVRRHDVRLMKRLMTMMQRSYAGDGP